MNVNQILTILMLACVTFFIERGPALAEPSRARVGPNCSVEGGQNFGVIIQTCAPKTALVSAPDNAQSAPVQQPDGTYTHDFVYQAPIGQRFSIRICGAEVVDYRLKALAPLIEISFEGNEGHHCNIKEYLTEVSPIILSVRTRALSLKFAIQTSTVQSVNAGQVVAAAAAQQEVSAEVAATPSPPPIIPVMPTIVFVPTPVITGSPSLGSPAAVLPR
jgi:hypothetical protein